MYLKCLYFDWYWLFFLYGLLQFALVTIPWHREETGHTLVDFHLQIYNIKIDNSNKTVVFFYDKTHFLTRLVSLQPLKGLFNIPKPIFTTRLLCPALRLRSGQRPAVYPHGAPQARFLYNPLRSWGKRKPPYKCGACAPAIRVSVESPQKNYVYLPWHNIF